MKTETLFCMWAAVTMPAVSACDRDRPTDALPGDEVTRQVETLHHGTCGSGQLCAQSRFTEVLDSFLHYREAGDPDGTPIVLLHGQPTWSFVYRNVIPLLPSGAHVVAPDTIGYGFSGRPDIDYSWSDHVDYIEAFIEEMGLEDIVLVVHDIGSFQGLAYAERHPENVRGIVILEGVVAPFPPFEDLESIFVPGSPQGDFAAFLELVRTDPAAADQLIVEDNVFIEDFLPNLTIRELTDLEMFANRLPFLTETSREKLKTIPLGIPVGGEPPENHELVATYAQWLATSPIPKLVLYGEPGFLLPPAIAEATAAMLTNAQSKSIGPGLHFLQEDQPEALAAAITAFYDGL